MDKITFAQKNNLIVKYQDGKSFYRDLELFKRYFQGHPLNTELAMANQFSEERLDGQMLNILLDEIDINEILTNRLEKLPEVPIKNTPEHISEVIKSHFNISKETIATIETNYLEFLKDKSDEAIIAFVAPIAQLDKQTEIVEVEQARVATSEEATTQKETETTEIPQTTETKTHSAKAITETEQAAAAISEQATTQKKTETTEIPQTTETTTHSAKAITETEQAAAAITEQATTQKETETTDTNKKKGQKAKSSPK